MAMTAAYGEGAGGVSRPSRLTEVRGPAVRFRISAWSRSVLNVFSLSTPSQAGTETADNSQLLGVAGCEFCLTLHQALLASSAPDMLGCRRRHPWMWDSLEASAAVDRPRRHIALQHCSTVA